MRIYRKLEMQQAPSAVALGLFDGVHLGHQAVIRAAQEAPDQTAVLTFDTEQERPAGKAQSADLLTGDDRLKRLRACGVEVVQIPSFSLLRDRSPKEFFEQVLVDTMKAKALFCGADFRFGSHAAGDVSLLTELAQAHGIQVSIVPQVCADGLPVSSTRIRALLAAGEMETVNRLLGYDYGLERPVIFGRKLGRTLDCPTINQEFPKTVCQPQYGVYAARVHLDGAVFAGVANLGVKPTVNGHTPLLETHILGVDGDFYGKTVQVDLLHFLRAEQKFEDIPALSAAIHQDIQWAKGYFAEKGMKP